MSGSGVPNASDKRDARNAGRTVADLRYRAASFFIGFFAGVCAAYFPPLVVAITASRAGEITEQGMQLFLLSPLYLVLAFAFSIVVGIVTLIFEWDLMHRPKEVFVTALGIPALLTGAIGTGSSAYTATDVGERLKRSDAALERDTDIRAPIDLDTLFENAFEARTPLNESRKLKIISTAFAATLPISSGSTKKLPTPLLLVASEVPSAVLVFGTAGSREEAEQLAQEVQGILNELKGKSKALYQYPDLTRIRIFPLQGEYLVISGGDPLPIRDANLFSKELGWDSNISVSVLPLDKVSNRTSILVRVSSNIDGLLDLDNRTICVLNAATAKRLRGALDRQEIRAKIDTGYKDISEALLLYNKGFCQVVLGDRTLLKHITYQLDQPDQSHIVDVSLQ